LLSAFDQWKNRKVACNLSSILGEANGEDKVLFFSTKAAFEPQNGSEYTLKLQDELVERLKDKKLGSSKYLSDKIDALDKRSLTLNLLIR
jgi:hypothetical protein